MTFPSLSVSVTIVLLNDVLMCACPMAMFFLDPASCATPSRGSARRCHSYVFVAAFLPRPTVFFGPLRVRAFVFVR